MIYYRINPDLKLDGVRPSILQEIRGKPVAYFVNCETQVRLNHTFGTLQKVADKTMIFLRVGYEETVIPATALQMLHLSSVKEAMFERPERFNPIMIQDIFGTQENYSAAYNHWRRSIRGRDHCNSMFRTTDIDLASSASAGLFAKQALEQAYKAASYPEGMIVQTRPSIEPVKLDPKLYETKTIKLNQNT